MKSPFPIRRPDRLSPRAGSLLLLALALCLFAGTRSALALALVLPAGALWSLGRAGASRFRRTPTCAAALSVHLDPHDGEMDGDVLWGPFTGQRLSRMTLSEIDIFERFLTRSGDLDSLRLLRAYLARRRSFLPRPLEEDARMMGIGEAYRILGLEPGASESRIRAAHARLSQRTRATAGEDQGFAILLTAARNLLLED